MRVTFPFGCIFSKMGSPRRAGQRTSPNMLVSVEYNVGDPHAQIPQNSIDFGDESNGTGLGTWKRVKTVETIGLASPSPYSSH